MKPAGIIGTGSYVPDSIMTNACLVETVPTSDEWIVSRTGIKARHIAGQDVATSDMAAIAAQRSLENAGVKAADLDMIIVATYTPYTLLPSTAAFVQHKIAASRAVALDLGAGCAGFVCALATGAQFIMTGMYRNVMVIGADACSRFLDWTDRNTCVLFGDGAGAVVLAPVFEGRGILASHLGSDGSGAGLLGIPAGGSRMPASEYTVQNKLHCIRMNGKEVFKFAVKIIPESVEAALNRCHLRTNDIDLLIPHQANLRIIQAAMETLALPPERVLINLEHYGNTSAASIPIALDEAFRSRRVGNGDVVALVGFGAGLTWGTVILRK